MLLSASACGGEDAGRPEPDASEPILPRSNSPTLDWQLIPIPFERLSQRGDGVESSWGRPEAEASKGLKLGFATRDWDVWIDNLGFYRAVGVAQ